MATTKSPEEIQAAARLRALSEGVRVYCLEAGYRYAIPSSKHDGSAYHLLVIEGDPACNCPAALNDRYCKHVAAVEMRLEAESNLLLAQVQSVNPQESSLVVDEELERKLAELYG